MQKRFPWAWDAGILGIAELRGELVKRVDDFSASVFPIPDKVWIGFGDIEIVVPNGALPTAFETGVFELVNGVFFDGNQAGLERSEPILVPPLKSDRAQCAPGKLREGVMRDRFPAVEEKGNLVAGENSQQLLVVTVKRADQHGGLAEPPPGAYVLEYFSRSQLDFGLRIDASGQSQTRRDLL